jgi:hypothetical protein
MASVGPIITVMISGLWSRYRASAQVRGAGTTQTPAGADLVEGIA